MAKPNRPARNVATPTATKTSSTKMLLIGGGVLFVFLIVLAVVLSKPWEGGDDSTVADAAPYQPSTVEGAALSPFSGAGGTDPAVGTIAPTVNGLTFTGEPMSITPDGKPKAVIFLTHWCQHCQKELPEITKWLRENDNDTMGVEFKTVSTGTTPARPNFPPAKWIKEEGYPFPVMADDATNKIGNAYGLQSYPYFVFLDGTNKVVARASGELSMTELETYLEELVSAK